MPRYAPKRKFVKKRRYVARRRNRVATKGGAGGEYNPYRGMAVAISTRNPFPTGVRKLQRFCEIRPLTTTTGLLGTQLAYYLNSIYDPYVGVGGHQPYGHDTMAEMYNRYRVISCRVQLTFTTPGGGSDIVCIMAASSNTSNGLTGLQLYQAQEQPGTTWGLLPSSGERRCILQQNYDMATLYGISKAAYMAENDYAAAIGANPAIPAYLTINTGCYDGTNAETCQCQIFLEYTVLFFDRTTLGLS